MSTSAQATPGKTASHFTIKLRCMSYKAKQNLYLAECIDLDITVQARSQEEAWEKLQDAVKGYIQVALEGDTQGLLHRPSPLSHQIRYYRAKFLNAILHTWRLERTHPVETRSHYCTT